MLREHGLRAALRQRAALPDRVGAVHGQRVLPRSRSSGTGARCARRAGSTSRPRTSARSACSRSSPALAARTGSWDLGPMRERAGAGAAVLARAGGLRPQGRHVSAARLAAVGARQRAQPRLGDPVRRRDQDGHLRARALQRLAAGARRRRLGGAALRRRRARCSASRSRSASTTSSGCSRTTASRTSASSSSGSASRWSPRRHGDAGVGAARAGRRAAARLEPRPVQGAAVPRRRLGAARDRHARDEPAGRAVAGACRGPRACFALGRGGDLRPAAAQRLRQRVARVPRPVRRGHAARGRSAWAAVPGRDPAGRDGRAGAGVLREGLRRRLPRRAAQRRGRRTRTSAAGSCARRCSCWRRRAWPSGSRRRCSGRPSARAAAAWRPAWTTSCRCRRRCVTLGALHAGARAASARWRPSRCWRRVAHNGVDARAVTWDCGYAAPTPRMQYTAGSFAAIITELVRVDPAPAAARAPHRRGTSPRTPATSKRTRPRPCSSCVVEPAGRRW